MALRNINPVRFDCMESVLEIEPKRHGDHRGFFAETYSRARYSDLGIRHAFVQDNHSLSARVGTLRGLHFQAPPHAQANWCDAGAVRSLMLRWTFDKVVRPMAIGLDMN